MDAVMKIEYKGYVIKVYPDQDPIDPREENDCFGHMICLHKRYSLGDKHDLRTGDFNGWDEILAHLETEFQGEIILPIYMYDHSGVTIHTTPFSCPWDSGQIGFIYSTKKEILAEFGNGGKRVTKGMREKAEKLLRGEVEEYDLYLRGEVYGYAVEFQGKEVDSCWGFLGDPEDYLLPEVKKQIDGYEKRNSGLPFHMPEILPNMA